MDFYLLGNCFKLSRGLHYLIGEVSASFIKRSILYLMISCRFASLSIFPKFAEFYVLCLIVIFCWWSALKSCCDGFDRRVLILIIWATSIVFIWIDCFFDILLNYKHVNFDEASYRIDNHLNELYRFVKKLRITLIFDANYHKRTFRLIYSLKDQYYSMISIPYSIIQQS